MFVLQDKSNIIAVRTAVLAGLVLHLKEDSSEVFKTCKVIYNVLDNYTGRTTSANIDCANVEMIYSFIHSFTFRRNQKRMKEQWPWWQLQMMKLFLLEFPSKPAMCPLSLRNRW